MPRQYAPANAPANSIRCAWSSERPPGGRDTSPATYLVHPAVDAAIDHCRNTIDMDPEFMPARRVLAAAYLQAGRHAEALSELESVVSLSAADPDPTQLSWLAHAKAVTGHRRDAVNLVALAHALVRERYVSR